MDRIPLYYTFGNHMHWVDMQWLWGYHVLPGSIRDMLSFCRETGAKGNVNFDGIGYEKLAAEDPEVLAELRDAVQDGMIEPVGCSYGQPYGLFHGGESNIRQRIYGARAVRRLLGVWPKTFWEEEFDFFPQLPQLLKGCGFEYASLFFQWTWHAPEVPKEDVPVVWWEGQDGSKLLCATRNKLNLHQWPEDMDATFAELAADPPDVGSGPMPLILQWLELMPSPDWMCRSELLLPKMRQLLADDRFEIKMATLGEYLAAIKQDVPVRRYTMDQVWHGMSLGKNGDNIRRRSIQAESNLLAAEAMASISSLFGRPYAQWDVYPIWELEEGWREILSAQHHDNDECEGLCGHVGKFSYERANSLGSHVLESQLTSLARRIPRDAMAVVQMNSLGWERTSHFGGPKVPAFGYASLSRWGRKESFEVNGELASFQEPGMRASVDLTDMRVTALAANGAEFEFGSNFPYGVIEYWIEGKEFSLTEVPSVPCGEEPEVSNGAVWRFKHSDETDVWVKYSIDIASEHGGVDFELDGRVGKRLDPGMNRSMQMRFCIPFQNSQIIVDSPNAVHEVFGTSGGHKKYPTGDWMTSPQWFENIQDSFTATSFVDVVDPLTGKGILILHDGSLQWLRRDGEVRCVLTAYDPWDEDIHFLDFECRLRFVPHGPISNADRWRMAQEFRNPVHIGDRDLSSDSADLPITFSALGCDAPNVVPTAFYRETEDFSGKNLDDYAGKGMGYPFVVRLVEFDGIETETTLNVSGTVARAYRTNLLGQIQEDITQDLKVRMRPFEIATVYLDIIEGRKQTRDLDAKREIWATVHRVEE